MSRLRQQLDALLPELGERLSRRGFERARLERWAASIGDGAAARANLLPGSVALVPDDLIASLPPNSSAEHRELAEIGGAALARGEVAICVLAGGMATRMGGMVKALMEILPADDDEPRETLLDVRLAETALLKERWGAPAPLWLMTSEPTHEPIVLALADAVRTALAEHASCFEQFVSLRLTEQGELFSDDRGEPSVYATGHGDLPDALRKTPMLQRFVGGGGRYVWISNLDNLGATIEPALLGSHIASGAPLSVELAAKVAGDKGGGPVLHDGRPIVAESFRVPPSFDFDRVAVFNTNTFLVDARALVDLEMSWTYLMVNKSVGDRNAIQFERLIGEMTMNIPTRLVGVPREGATSRFVPIKSAEDIPGAQAFLRELRGPSDRRT